MQLGRRWEAKEAFQQSLKHLGSAANLKPEKRESFEAEIKTEIDKLSSEEKLEKTGKVQESSKRDIECPFAILEPNKSFPVLAGLDNNSFDFCFFYL